MATTEAEQTEHRTHYDTEVHDHRLAPWRRLSWGAIIAGFLIAMSLQLVFSVLGLWLNLWSFEVGTDDTFTGLATSAAIWWIITGSIAIFAGSWLAAYMSGTRSRTTGSAHGLTVWGLLTLVSFYFASSALGSLISASAYAVNTSLESVTGGQDRRVVEINVNDQTQGNQSQQTANNQQTYADSNKSWNDYVPLTAALESSKELLRETDKEALKPEQLKEEGNQLADRVASSLETVAINPQKAEQELKALLDEIYAKTDDERKALDQEALVSVISANSALNEQEAQKAVDRWQQLYENQVKPEAKELASVLQEQYQQAVNRSEEMAENAQQEIVQSAQQMRETATVTARKVATDVAQKAEYAADKSVDVLARSSGWMFLILLFGIAAALGGGCVGTDDPVETT